MGGVWGKAEKGVVVMGFSGAGKTTLLHQMKTLSNTSSSPSSSLSATSMPVIGFAMETVSLAPAYPWQVTVLCCGGQHKVRPLWRHFFEATSALVFVIDSSDRDVIEDLIAELQWILAVPELKGKPVLFLANQVDKDNVIPIGDLVNRLGLASTFQYSAQPSTSSTPASSTGSSNTTTKPWMWQILPTSGLTGEGVKEALQWLSGAIEHSST